MSCLDRLWFHPIIPLSFATSRIPDSYSICCCAEHDQAGCHTGIIGYGCPSVMEASSGLSVMLQRWPRQCLSIPYRMVGNHMVSERVDRDADSLLHRFRVIGSFAELKVVLFPGSPLHSIPPVINACAVRFPDENIPTDCCLTVPKPSR